MSNPIIPNKNCAHCNSSRMEYYGCTFGGFHFYYKCLDCHKYTEYRISLKNMLVISFIILLSMAFITILAISILLLSPLLAIVFFFASIILYLLIVYRYRWYGWEKIALKHIPSDSGILRAPNKRIRFIILAFFIVAFLGYTTVFIINLLRQP